MQYLRFGLLGCLLTLALMPSAFAVLSDDYLPPNAGDPDYNAGVEAWKREDWRATVEHMTKVITRRPWDDNAHNLMGFAYRKLGDYDRALEHYQKALELNPHHRGALEYLGETYVEMGQLDKAKEMLERLAVECRRITGALTNAAQPECAEWQDLKTAIEAHR